MTNIHFEKHLSVINGEQNSLDLLAEETQLSKTELKQVMQKGAVWITRNQHTQRLRRAKKTLLGGDELHIYYDEKILNTKPLPARCIEKNTSYSIWYKPYGVYCQGSKWGDHCTINRQVEQVYQQPAYIVHRLDRATTGLIIIAHHKKTAAILSSLFAQRKVEKKYLAIVNGEFPETTEPLKINTSIADKTAISRVKKLNYNPKNNLSLVEVAIETGRKHQIRIHLCDLGFPIIGDRLYTSSVANNCTQLPDLQLSCYQLAFQCPETNQTKYFQLDEALQPSIERLQASNLYNEKNSGR